MAGLSSRSMVLRMPPPFGKRCKFNGRIRKEKQFNPVPRESPSDPALGGMVNLLLCSFFLLLMMLTIPASGALGAEKEVTFEIEAFSVEGSSLLSADEVDEVLQNFLGEGKSAADVEKARTALEKKYHEKGYPAVLVNIPEQTVTEGTIALQVIESKIGNVRVTGNRFFTEEKILRELPSMAPGQVLYVPEVQKDFEKINRGQDIKASPVLTPGKEMGTTDVEVKVQDQLPLHGSLEINNRGTQSTTDLRLNAMIGYYNLWQKEHALSAQYQMSPQNLDQVKALALSYVLPNPWKTEQQLALYSIFSDSQSAFGQGFQVIGKGQIYGARYVIPLSGLESYAHNATVGLDYKDIKENQAGVEIPVRYLPLSLGYNSSLVDGFGQTRFGAGVNMAFRGAVTQEEQFQVKRFEANGNYIYATASVERLQKLPAGMGLFLKLDGQLSDQPLIANEQYAAGGMVSVRGYKELEAFGDNAVHGTAELSAPELMGLLGLGDRLQFTPYLFYDFAATELKQPLPGQHNRERLQGTGAGVRGLIFKKIDYELDFGVALSDTSQTPANTRRFNFRVKYQF